MCEFCVVWTVYSRVMWPLDCIRPECLMGLFLFLCSVYWLDSADSFEDFVTKGELPFWLKLVFFKLLLCWFYDYMFLVLVIYIIYVVLIYVYIFIIYSYSVSYSVIFYFSCMMGGIWFMSCFVGFVPVVCKLNPNTTISVNSLVSPDGVWITH